MTQPPVTPKLFEEMVRVLDEAIAALGDFPSDPHYTRNQCAEVDEKMAVIGAEVRRIKGAVQYRRRTLNLTRHERRPKPRAALEAEREEQGR